MSTQRIALITGASRGIGRAVALEAARRGWRVICAARSSKALEQLDDEIKALGGEATLAPLDLKDGDSLDRFGAALYERFGKLDGLAACAGVLGTLTPAHQAEPKMMDEAFAVNYTANYRLIRAMHPLLKASDAGRAVFLTSGASRMKRAYWSAYAASKAALDMLVFTYAAEQQNVSTIRANLFNPGPTRTTMRAKAFPGEDPTTLPTPEEVAVPVVDMIDPTYAENGAWVQFERA